MEWLAVAVLFGVALFVARKRLRAALTVAVPIVALLGLSACSDGSDDEASAPQIEEGSVHALSAADTLIFTDQLGSVLSETSGTGKVKGRFAAHPYGVARQDTSTETRLYADTPRDKGVGLDLMGARFYAPDLGVWTLGDPVLVTAPEKVATAEFGTANAYAYANLNPVVARDQDGNFWHIAVGAAVGFAVGGTIEAVRQYAEHGRVTDVGRVFAASAGGAVAGALITAAPGVGIAHAALQGAGAGAAAGMTTRLITSGGKSTGTVREVATDAALGAATGGALRGAQVAGGRSAAVRAPSGTPQATGAARGGRITDPSRLLPERAGPTGHISPSEVAGKMPVQIDARARELGLIPRGPDPAGGRGAYVDPQTGQQRILSHPNGTSPHGQGGCDPDQAASGSAFRNFAA